MRKWFLLLFIFISLPFVASDFQIDNPTIPHINSGTSSSNTFIRLGDTPNSYTGSGGLCLKVNSGATAIEFSECNATAGGNSSWSQALADTLYADIKWGYNQTTATYNTYNDAWSSTYNLTYATTTNEWDGNKTSLLSCVNNASYLSTYNATYNNILAQQCPSGYVVNGTYANGTFICKAETSGSMDYTNVAMINKSNTFAEEQTFSKNVTMTADSMISDGYSHISFPYGSTIDIFSDEMSINSALFLYNSLYLNNTLSCDADNEKLETDSDGKVSCGVNPVGGGNPFDQVLNKSSDVVFNSANISYINKLINLTSEATGGLNLRTYGDYDDYIQFTMDTGQPVIQRMGGSSLFLKSDDASELLLQLREDSTHRCNLAWDKTNDFFYIDSTSDIRLLDRVNITDNLDVEKNITIASKSTFYENGTCTIWKRGGSQISLCD